MNEIEFSTGLKKTLLYKFLEISERFPDRIAVRTRDKYFSYRTLKKMVISIANGLYRLKVKPGDIVAVELSPSEELIAALLAVQYVGGAYVPLDKRAPIERNNLILNDANPSVIITDRKDSPHSNFTNVNINYLTSSVSSIHPCEQSRIENTAYIIYTSGTTGKPKGVQITHGNLESLFSSTEIFYKFNELDVTILYHSYAFDFSVWEIWSALCYGGKLVIPTEVTKIIPSSLARLIKEEGVTLLNQTPTAFANNAEDLCLFNSEDFSLRCIIFGGERLNYQTLERWNKKFGLNTPILVNMYGITETTVHTSLHVVCQEDLINSDSNIGKVLPDFNYVIRPVENESLEESGGELLLSGPQVSSGYLNENNEKNGKFVYLESSGLPQKYYCSGDMVKHNSKGELIYLGRCDNQLKINGFRIETGEIESVLAQVEEIDDISVLASNTELQGHHIVCFFTTSSNITKESIIKKLISKARKSLPFYMRPMRYRIVSEMKKTVNGKIDKQLILQSME